MSDSDEKKAAKLAELKENIEEELNQLMKKLKAGTIDRKTLESGLKRMQRTAKDIPWFKH